MRLNCQLSKRDKTVLSGLFPLFKRQITSFLDLCWENGIPVHLSAGFRTFAEEDAIYAAGKSHTKGGQSHHNYGVAVDIVFDNSDRDGVQDPYVMPFEGAWLSCAQLGSKCNLQPGYFWASFQDKPHYQANLNTTIEELRSAYIKGGIQSAWDLLYLKDKDSFKVPPSVDIADESIINMEEVK